ncbi:hypothetical protein [Methanoregula sp.]|uniref:hypothetical protein n=1 Tax=Methanoregula sp. TaxID=2052170 RepID=UPI003C757EFD
MGGRIVIPGLPVSTTTSAPGSRSHGWYGSGAVVSHPHSPEHFALILVLILLCLPLVLPQSAALPPASVQVTPPAQGSTMSGNLSAGNQTPAFLYPTATSLPDVTYPSISDNHRPGTINKTFTFRFGKENITIRANVSTALYEGARNGIKYAVAPPGSPVEELAPGYYQAFVNDPRQEPLYDGLLQEFRAVRSKYNLTDDEYLELMTVFVQDLPYDEVAGLHPDNPPRFPVETVVDGTGDCDDKSVLLAGLLSREGYDVVLFLFIPEHHMAVGVRNESDQYRATGYMYIETTYTALVGEVPRKLILSEKYEKDGQPENVSILNSTPIVIRIGSGTTPYTSADETGFILGERQEIDEKIAGLRMNMGNCTYGNASCNETIEQEYDKYAILHNYLVEHPYDRTGLYQYLRPVVAVTSPGQNSTCPPYLSTTPGKEYGGPASGLSGSNLCLPGQEPGPLTSLWLDLRLFSASQARDRQNTTPVFR